MLQRIGKPEQQIAVQLPTALQITTIGAAERRN
jgi:hypothetical protein